MSSERRTRLVNAGFMIVIAACAAALMWRAGAQSGPAPTPPMFTPGVTLQQARERALQQHSHALIVVTASWCVPCQQYKRGALRDARVQAWTRAHAIPVMLDLDRDAAAATLNADAVPLTILEHGGVEIRRRAGALPADELLAWLEAAAAEQ